MSKEDYIKKMEEAFEFLTIMQAPSQTEFDVQYLKTQEGDNTETISKLEKYLSVIKDVDEFNKHTTYLDMAMRIVTRYKLKASGMRGIFRAAIGFIDTNSSITDKTLSDLEKEINKSSTKDYKIKITS